MCKTIDGQEKWAYINKDFNCITDFEFDGVYLFSADGFAAVKVEDKWGFIKEDGSWLLKPQFYSVQSFSNGYAAVSMMKNQEIKIE